MFINKEAEIFDRLFPNKTKGYWFRGGYANFPKGSILEFWGGSGQFASTLSSNKDFKFVLAPSDKYYLDCGYGNQYSS